MTNHIATALTPGDKVKLRVPGDWNAFFGLGTNILVNPLVLTGLLRYVLKMPDALCSGASCRPAGSCCASARATTLLRV